MRTHRTRIAALGVLLMVSGLARGQDASPSAEDALVVVAIQALLGTEYANGFVVGDGSLVVTAYHVAYARLPSEEHESANMMTLVSPYLGDACSGRVVAADRELDIAILECPWKGHPSLALADDRAILASETLRIVGVPINETMRAKTEDDFRKLTSPRKLDLAVGYLAVRKGEVRFFRLQSDRRHQLNQGWSGSAVFLPGSDRVAGMFATTTEISRAESESVERATMGGPAAGQIRRLIEEAALSQRLQPAKAPAQRPKEAKKAYVSCLRAMRGLIHHRPALQDCLEFQRLRPKSAFGYRMGGFAAAAAGNAKGAEEMFQKALSLEPDNAALLMAYASYLAGADRKDEALRVFEKTWDQGELKPFLALGMTELLGGRGQFKRSIALVKEALKQEPKNSYLWFNLGRAQVADAQAEDGLASLEKATALAPQIAPFRAILATNLERAGRLDDAEKHFRKLAEIDHKQPLALSMLARFLADHRPGARQEALGLARRARGLKGNQPLLQQIDALIAKLESKDATAKKGWLDLAPSGD